MLTPAKRSLPALGAGIWQLDVGAGALDVVEGVEGAVVAVPGTHWKYAAGLSVSRKLLYRVDGDTYRH